MLAHLIARRHDSRVVHGRTRHAVIVSEQRGSAHDMEEKRGEEMVRGKRVSKVARGRRCDAAREGRPRDRRADERRAASGGSRYSASAASLCSWSVHRGRGLALETFRGRLAGTAPVCACALYMARTRRVLYT